MVNDPDRVETAMDLRCMNEKSNRVSRPAHTEMPSLVPRLRKWYRALEQTDLAIDTKARFWTVVNRLLRPSLYDGVGVFCLFVGHGRSGSTLVGALLNAHKNIVLANELDALRCIRRRMSRIELFNYIHATSRSQAKHGSTGGGGYSYAVPGQWQGRHEELLVIGDRKAGTAAIRLFREPHLLECLQDTVQVPVKMVCVIRNPFDSITTTFKKTFRWPNELPETHLRRQIDAYFDRCIGMQVTAEKLGESNVCYVRHEQMLAEPRRQLSQLCEFLGVAADDEYLDNCVGIVQCKPSITRSSTDWNSELVEAVLSRQENFIWLRDYEFGG